MISARRKWWVLLPLALMLSACDPDIIVHDETRAAELIVDFLDALKSPEGIELAYAWTDDRYKETTSRAEFGRLVAEVRRRNAGADIALTGFEVFGPVETMAIYARSMGADQVPVYFRFILSGSKTHDYYLLQWHADESAFKTEGIYHDYPAPQVVVAGV